MKLLMTFAFVIILFIVTCSPMITQAWQFNMSGLMEWKYEYYAQQGTRGFFGVYDIDNSFRFPRELRSNAWLGIETLDSLFHGKHPGVVSGSDASRSVMKMELYPEIRINPALVIRGKYRIGGHTFANNDMLDDIWDDIGPGFNNEYVNGMIPGRNNGMAFGEWSMLWFTANTPWGRVGYGKKPFTVGCGLLYNSEDATEESLLLEIPYGPLALGIGFYPMTIGQVDFFDIRRRNQVAYFILNEEILDYYGENPVWDHSGRPNKGLGYINYASGNVSAGLGAQYTGLHFGFEGRPVGQGLDWASIDQSDLEGWIFLKYNNGRFFFNSEVDFFTRNRRISQSLLGGIDTAPDPTDGGGGLFAPTYVESWRWMVETGFFAGPAKLSLLYSFIPGPDRRHGVLIDKQPTTFPIGPIPDLLGSDQYEGEQAGHLNRHVGNSGVFRPYSLLLGYGYGSGVNCYDLNGNGCFTDASVLAARIDYAAAANLNVYCSFLHAERASHGWQWGTIYPASKRLRFGPRPNGFNRAREFTEPVPTIPDTALGWELNLGCQWELLSNWTLDMTAAYWRPGKWFNYACIDRGVENWNRARTASNWGINPNRSIDPIVGLEIVSSATF